MPKRKRDDDTSVDSLFFRFRTDLFHALKTAKGFERQRQSKRLTDPKSAPDKRARLDKEVAVLKSLDLYQTAHAHLCSSLLRIKAVADSEKLPNEIRAGVPKPELTEEERSLLHNVTSSLYNRAEVRAVVEKATEAICRALGVAVPDKRGRVKGKDKGQGGDEAVRDGVEKAHKEGRRAKDGEEAKGGAEERAGKGQQNKHADASHGQEEEADESEEEKAISKLDRLLGLDSGDEDEESEEELIKGRTRKANSSMDLDPMEITTDEDDGDDEGDDGGDLDPMEVTSDEEDAGSGSEDEFQGFSEPNDDSSADEDEDASGSESSASSIARPPPAKKPATSAKATKALKPTDSTFLPTLMGGYLSGSESASDVDLAPARKNRRGQRARQMIWEKKYGEKAKHVQQPAKGRDSGWDSKRGAVDGDSKPWKRGIRNPLADKRRPGAGDARQAAPKKEAPERKRDDTGALHPSWEARRLAKAKEQLTAPFQGKKITFD